MSVGITHLPAALQVRKDLDIRAGDTVRVHVKIEEKGKSRVQIFEGLVLAVKHGREAGATFTVRKISNGVGVERIFPIYSPSIDKIEIVKRSRPRRAKLYYIRTKVAREVRRKMRNFVNYFGTTEDLVIPADEMEDEIPEEDVVATEEAGTEAPVSEENTTAEAPEVAEATEAPADETETAEKEESAEEETEEEKA